MGRGRDRRTETLVPVARAGFGDETDSIFDPTTRRVSTRALRDLLAESIDADAPTTHVPLEMRPPPIKRKSQRILEELRNRRGGGAVAEPFGRYMLLGSVGAGGMAEVRLAAEIAGGGLRLCVIKRAGPHHPNAEQQGRALREEARVSAMLRHPNVVTLLDSGEIDGAPFLVFELIDGVSLRELADILKPLRVPLPGVLEIGRACAHALAHAHSLGVVHRDATPQNVLVARDGTVKLVDFGIARFEGREHLTQRGHVKGKLGYMAPEQCRTGPIDGKADVFALGLVLVELIAGERVLPSALVVVAETEPLVRSKLQRAQEEVPPELAQLLVRMTALAPEERPTAEEVGVALSRLLEDAEGEPLAELVARAVFAEIEPFEVAVSIDPPPFETLPTESSYAQTIQALRPSSDAGATRRIPPPLPPPSRPPSSLPSELDAERPKRALFFFALGTAIFAFLALVFVLRRS